MNYTELKIRNENAEQIIVVDGLTVEELTKQVADWEAKNGKIAKVAVYCPDVENPKRLFQYDTETDRLRLPVTIQEVVKYCQLTDKYGWDFINYLNWATFDNQEFFWHSCWESSFKDHFVPEDKREDYPNATEWNGSWFID